MFLPSDPLPAVAVWIGCMVKVLHVMRAVWARWPTDSTTLPVPIRPMVNRRSRQLHNQLASFFFTLLLLSSFLVLEPSTHHLPNSAFPPSPPALEARLQARSSNSSAHRPSTFELQSRERPSVTTSLKEHTHRFLCSLSQA